MFPGALDRSSAASLLHELNLASAKQRENFSSGAPVCGESLLTDAGDDESPNLRKREMQS